MNKKTYTVVSGILILLSLSGLFAYKIWKGKQTSGDTKTVQTGHEGQEHRAQSIEDRVQKTEDRAQVTEDGGQKAEASPSVVEISPEKQQLIGIKTGTADYRNLTKVIRTVGRLDYDERKVAIVNTKIEGWIETLYVNYTGRFVKKGEPLLSIYSPELVSTQEEYLLAMRGKKSVEKSTFKEIVSGADYIIEAAKRRLSLWDISEEQIKELERTGKPQKTLTLHSPVTGYVIEKMALQGMMVKAGETLFKIADLSILWVLADIYEYEMPFIKIGQKAKITMSYLPGQEFISKIDYIYPAIEGETRTAKVRFELPNPGLKLRPMMFSNIEIKIDLGRRLSVPEDAVLDSGKRQLVFVDKGEGRFEAREVVLGNRIDGYD